MLQIKNIAPVFFILLVNPFLLFSQSIQLFTEDFQIGGSTFTLNGSGPGTNSGSNKWIINNNYNGAPTYPNTMPQDSTYSGTIGFAPYSQYLHIHDEISGISSCNYNPANTSDRFAYMTSGLCTYGMDSVHISFFYLCEGSADAYGKVYYSANNGPWIQVGESLYNNKYKWQYEDITDPAFSNVGNLRFGFRWENGNGSPPYTQSFAIDDINIVAGFYPLVNPVTITIDSVVPNPVCQGTNIFIYYSISDTLCDGSYIIELSDSSGNFPGSNSWIYNIYYPQTSGAVSIQLPNLAKPASCYKVRINRTSPAPAITGVASACFTILDCPNVITTLQPVVTFDTNAVCAGSVIEVPFYSTGVYTFNTYTAQLSDSDGTFPATPTVVGTFNNSATYDPNLGSLPGTVSGLVPAVTPGCNYYLRVVSSNPVSTGTLWGPFCIQECDITTNNKQSLQFCVTDCAVSPDGSDTSITVDMNYFDSTVTYGSGNEFQIQLLDKMFFSQVGTNGSLGTATAINDTTILIHIPCKDSLSIIGVAPGSYYMRIIASNSSDPENSLGTLVNLTVGAPRANPPVITAYDYNTFLAEDTFCTGEYVGYYFNPYNYNDKSTYQWQSPQFFGGNPFSWTNVGGDPNSNQSPYVFTLNTPGIIVMKVKETNFGCQGAWSMADTVVFLGPPAITITGPSLVCQGDTNHYEVPFFDNTYYSWTATNGTIIDTSNNEIELQYNNTGTYQVKMTALNQCGSSTSTKFIQVKPYPVANAGLDTSVCSGTPVNLSTPTGSGYGYIWTDGSDTVGYTASITYIPDSTTTIILSVVGQGGCKRYDTVNIFTKTTPVVNAGTDTTVCTGNPVQLFTPYSPTSTYVWSDAAGVIGNANFIVIAPGSTTTYYLFVIDTSGCYDMDTVTINTVEYPVAFAGNDTGVCAGDNVVLSAAYSATNNYSWSDGISVISTGNTATVAPGTNTYYYLSVINSTNCISKDTILLTVNPYPLINAGQDSTICLYKSIGLSTPAGAGYVYSWSDGNNVIGTENTIDVSPANSTLYYLTVAAPGGCEKKDTVAITVQSPLVSEYADSLCPDGSDSLFLNAPLGDAWLWNNGASGQQLVVTTVGTYTVSVYYSDSICEKPVIYQVTEKTCPDLVLVLPNIFSPTGDGLNDVFTPISSGIFDRFNIKIFNRWGTLMYESEEPHFEWNGKNKAGEPGSDGVYFYIIETTYRTNEKKYTGYVTLTK